MAQVFLKAFQIFCGIGGQYIGPFLMPIINPFNWSILVLSVFLPIYLSPPNALNYDYEKNEKNSTKAFGFSFLIYYIISVILFCLMYRVMCSIADSVDPTTMGTDNATNLLNTFSTLSSKLR